MSCLRQRPFDLQRKWRIRRVGSECCHRETHCRAADSVGLEAGDEREEMNQFGCACEQCERHRQEIAKLLSEDKYGYLLDASTPEHVIDEELKQLNRRERRGWVRAARRRERGNK